jgi:hypothetical protein
VPAHIEIDCAKGRAAWLSLLGVEEFELTASHTPPRTVF